MRNRFPASGSQSKDACEAAGVRGYRIASPRENSVEVYRRKEGRCQSDNGYCVFPEWDRIYEGERAAFGCP